MKTMTVVSAKNPVPMEENSRRYISDKPIEVSLTTYYRRRIQAGELKEYTPPAPAKSTSPAAPSPVSKPEEK